MTIKELLASTLPNLSKLTLCFPERQMEDLLLHILNETRAFLYSNPDFELTSKQIKKFNKLFSRLLAGEPLAYLTGTVGFYGLDFVVNKNVLIPRPETEQLVEMVIHHVETLHATSLQIVDIGTGSGNIIISLAKNLKGNFSFYALDKSKRALEIAKLNAKNHQVLDKIKFLQGDLFNPLKQNKVDIIIANLPYLSEKEFQNSPTQKALSFEPKNALITKDDGLYLIEKLIKTAPKYLNANGVIYLEIGYNQGDIIKTFAKKIFPQSEITTFKDINGFDRFIAIKKAV